MITRLLPLVLGLVACQAATPPEAPQPTVGTLANTTPYGAWPSPITAASIEEGSRSLHSLAYAGGYLYWVEGRPEEGGRNVIVRWRPDSAVEDVLPAAFNARTRVHEYGGRSVLVAGDTLWFSNFTDQRLYRMRPGEEPRAITPELPLRYGACALDAPRERLICIREDHRGDGEPRNTLVALPWDGMSEGEVLFGDSDFVAAASLSPDGRRIAFVSWDHPNMPWDNTTLWSASFDASGALGDLVAHNGPGEAVMDPQFDAHGKLYAISDRDDWWKLYRIDGETFSAVPSGLSAVEVGGPAWGIGEHFYRFLDDGSILAQVAQGGVSSLYRLDPAAGSAHPLALESAVVVDFLPRDGQLYVINVSAARPTELLATGLDGGAAQVIRRAKDDSPDPAWIPAYQQVSFPTGDGATAHGIYYPPTNPQVQAPADSAPPLMVFIHGGPTSVASPGYSLSKLYWTSRGFAILDVNHRGSTGYGREFRQALYGLWGVVDVEDAVAGASWLARQGKADPQRLVIRGGSAGGYTTLAALAMHEVFSAGTSLFGISDIEALAHDTHKFESRYLDQLIGPYPESRALYVERSPIHHLDGFNAPLLLLQGLEDRVVPPNQSEMIFEALKARGIPTAYIAFEGEGHGFRRAENAIRAREAEYAFYARILGFTPAEPLPPVEIVGLPAPQ